MSSLYVTRRSVFSCFVSLLFFYSTTGIAATPPTGLSATVVGNTVTLQWTRSTSSGVEYRIFRRLHNDLHNEERVVMANGYRGLSYRDGNVPVGTYTYAVKALGTDGTVSRGARVRVVVAGDIQSPQAPARLSAQGTSTSTIDLSWAQATDNVGVTGYEIYRDGRPLAAVSGAATLRHTDTNLRGGTAYTYQVRAVDAVGLRSAWSPSAVGNTLQNLTTVTLSLSTATPRVGSSVRVTASATDLDGNLQELKICEVLSSGDVCDSVATGPQSVLQGYKEKSVSTLLPRQFYAAVSDSVGGTSKTSIYTAVGKAHLYVDGINGLDSAKGSETSPLKTIQAAIAKANATDNYIAVKAGQYTERVIINKSGITLDGQKLAIVLAPNNSNLQANPGAINVVGGTTQTVVVRGFNVGNNPGTSAVDYDLIKGYVGIFVGEGARNVTVEDNVVRLTESSGIMLRNARDVKVLNNIVEKTNAGARSFYDTNADFNRGYVLTDCEARFNREKAFRAKQEMISIIGTHGFEVRNNEVFNGAWTINGMCVVGKEGIDAKSGSSNGQISGNKVHDILKLGLYLDAWNDDMTNITVDSNRVWNTRQGLVLSVEASDVAAIADVRITNNVLYKNKSHGIYITAFCCSAPGKPTEGNGPRRDIKIINNTLYGNGGNGLLIGERTRNGVTEEARIDGVVIINNVVAYNDGAQMNNMTNHRVGGAIIARNNLVAGRNVGNLGGTVGNPTFRDLSAANLALWNFQLEPNPSSAYDGIDDGYGGSVLYSVAGVPKTIPSINGLVTHDATGVTRLTSSNTVLDLGAYEKH